MTARKTTIGVVAAVAVGGATAAAVVVGLPDAEGGSTPRSALPAATAAVTRETLVDTVDHDGKLAYGETTTITARLAGTVTALPGTGKTIKRGTALSRVDNTPVVLLYGTLPAYRTLAPGVTGADVKQFEKNLWALGYRGFTVDTTYSSATATAVRDWQDDLGLTETGVVDPARVVYASGPVRVETRKAEIGAQVQPGAELLTVTGTDRLAVVDLDVDDQRLATVGAAVTVTPSGGTAAPGRITAAETIVVPGEGQQEDTTKVEVTVGFPAGKAPKGLDQASVTVAFTAARRKNVLTVPVAALLALAEGGYGVQVVDAAATRIVAVQTGLFAAGRVEITGDGLTEGMTIGVPA
jgi:peptidoglycan hydrolase-like protein with peptidoglycan-binding domain